MVGRGEGGLSGGRTAAAAAAAENIRQSCTRQAVDTAGTPLLQPHINFVIWRNNSY